jgi:3-hexulose-6-phosphate synthase
MKQQEPLLQIAFDILSINEAIAIAETIYPYFDIAEIGTPLIIEEGMYAVEAIKTQLPNQKCLADLKIMDAGGIEARSGFVRGANIVTVLAAADDVTISNALVQATKFDGEIMVDLINISNPAERAKQLEDMGVETVCVHTAYDVQSAANNPLEELSIVRSAVSCKVAVAGGLKRDNVQEVMDAGANIIIVGSAITKNPDPASEARAIFDIIHKN